MARALQGAALIAAAAAQLPIPLGSEFGTRPSAFVNIVLETRQWANPANTSENTPVDENGWPTADAFTVVFDDRAAFAWAPPCDDPLCLGAVVNGTYYFNLSGMANVSLPANEGMGKVVLSSITYDPVSWTTAGYITVPPGAPALLILVFANTRRTPSSPTNTGFTNLRIIQPNYWPQTPGKIFVDEVATVAKPFHHMRFMGWTGTNTNPGYYGDVGHHILNWTNRCLPSDAIAGSTFMREGCWGYPWEYVVAFAQETGKGIWVNLPVSASGWTTIDPTSYLYQWASLLKNGNAATGNQGVPPGTVIYVEHSNEVWNYGFGQYIWNKLAAIDECTAPNTCTYNNDGTTDQEKWARRRHMKRLYDISLNFANVFGQSAMLTQIRPIWSWWTIQPDQYNDTLAWFAATYGPPSKYFYGVAMAGYFGKKPGPNDDYDTIFASYTNDSMSQIPLRTQIAKIASSYGLKLTAYESGPGWQVGDTTDLTNIIMANRQAGMNAVVKNDILNSWIPSGGSEYNYFAACGEYSRFGQWGAMEDYHNASTPKYCALVEMQGGQC